MSAVCDYGLPCFSLIGPELEGCSLVFIFYFDNKSIYFPIYKNYDKEHLPCEKKVIHQDMFM